ncbi:MAG: glucuronate isomerase, partial [Clostridia bacterium]|nr:glucuronate isomerase [Clostridia bacterium]
MSYYNEDFLLTNKSAKKLYKEYAAKMPIFDYHCHLSEKELLEDKEFEDIYQVWLGGDHYKWRLMRNFGIDEEYITGNKSHKEKFMAYVKALETAFGNPLYHWSQVELKEFFNCELEITQENAETIWNWSNDFIKVNHLTPSKLIKDSFVKCVFTTNELFDDLTTFPKLKEKFSDFAVIPAYRADKFMNIDNAQYPQHVQKLSGVVGSEIKTLDDLENAAKKRMADFIGVGTVAGDISVERVYAVSDRNEAAK